jgi:hypothetical protein
MIVVRSRPKEGTAHEAATSIAGHRRWPEAMNLRGLAISVAGDIRNMGSFPKPFRLAVLVTVATACGGSSASPVAGPASAAPPAAAGWLSTSGARILTSEGTTWMGRGVNLPDTRSCGACVLAPPSVAEVKRRIDEAVDQWGANFLRLLLESYPAPDGKTQWRAC